jgi:hypothetical protein
MEQHENYFIHGEIEILGMSRTQKKRLSDINPFKICFVKSDEKQQMLRYEIKSISIRRLRNGKAPQLYDLSAEAWHLLETYATDYLDVFRASWA